MNFVLDASVALAWCFDDEKDRGALGVLERLRSDEAVVPPIWSLEVANGLVAAERRQRLDGVAVARAGRLILALPIVVEPMDRERSLSAILPVARRRDLSVYDASYLELALRRGIPLATLDRGLAQAARAEGVEGALRSDHGR